MISKDAGETWEIKSTPHGDNHDIWINPENDNIWIQSNDGGGNVTLIQEKHGQHSSTNLQQKYIKLKLIISIHTGFMVDNKIIIVLYQFLVCLHIQFKQVLMLGFCQQEDVKLDLRYQSQVIPTLYIQIVKVDLVYTINFWSRKKLLCRSSKYVWHNPKDLKYRFQRVSPIHISPHNEDIIYHGSQFLHKTTDGVLIGNRFLRFNRI